MNAADQRQEPTATAVLVAFWVFQLLLSSRHFSSYSDAPNQASLLGGGSRDCMLNFHMRLLLITLLLQIPSVPCQHLRHMRQHGKDQHHHDKSRVHAREDAPAALTALGECHNGTCPSMEALARSKRLEPGATLPIVFANREYWPTLLNGLLAQSKISPALPRMIGVVCLDDGGSYLAFDDPQSLPLLLPSHSSCRRSLAQRRTGAVFTGSTRTPVFSPSRQQLRRES